jgi:hypothetical protein
MKCGTSRRISSFGFNNSMQTLASDHLHLTLT